VTTLPTRTAQADCWNRIGVWGDRSCPELATAVHCHSCPVFSAAGRRFLDGESPPGYLEEWAARLAVPEDAEAGDLQGVLVFRLGGEWLALPVGALLEVIPLRPVHRIPFRGGLLAGVVNVRGELHLSVRMDHLLGITRGADQDGTPSATAVARLLVVGRGAEVWVFPVDEVDRVHRFPAADLGAVPPTLGRAAARFTRGVFRCGSRAVGFLDERRLFEALRTKVR
jgi:chemotaxis-related protein WspD